MDELFDLHPSGVFLRREALAFGYSDRDLLQHRRAGVIQRVRHGAYVDAQTWSRIDVTEQHRRRCSAVAMSHGGSVAFSHVSAVVLHGVEVWGTDLERVHVVKRTGTRSRTDRRNGDVVYHEDSAVDLVTIQPEGLHVVTPRRAVLGAASMSSVEAGVVIVDSAYRRGVVDPDDLRQEHELMRGWPGTARLQMTLRLSQVGSESVGESRARFLFWRCHLPKPVLQYEVKDSRGQLIGIADFGWPELGVLGEFDGRVKYGRLLRPGQEPGDAVYAEKLREDRMREATGWRFFRLCWDDLSHPGRTAERFWMLSA